MKIQGCLISLIAVWSVLLNTSSLSYASSADQPSENEPASSVISEVEEGLSESGFSGTVSVDLADGAMSAITGSPDNDWIENINLTGGVCLVDGNVVGQGTILVNEASYCSVDIDFDFSSWRFYVRSPEIKKQFLVFDIKKIANEVLGEEGFSLEQFPSVSQYEQDYMSDFTEKEVIDFLSRYAEVFVSNLSGFTKREETIALGDKDKDCVVYTLSCDSNGVVNMVEQMLTVLMDDAFLKKIWESDPFQQGTALYGTGIPYVVLQRKISELLEDASFRTDLKDDLLGLTFYLQIAVDTQNRSPVSLDFLVKDPEGTEYELFNMQKESDASQFAVTGSVGNIVVSAFGMSGFSFSCFGNDKDGDGLWNGIFALNNGEAAAPIAFSNVGVASDGALTGTYTFTGEDANISLDTRFGNDVELTAVVGSPGVRYLTVKITGNGTSPDLAVPDVADAFEYDVRDETSIDRYMSDAVFPKGFSGEQVPAEGN